MTAEAKRTNSKSSWSTCSLCCAARLGLLFFQALGGFEVHAAEGVEVVLGQDALDGRCLLGREVGVLVELGLEPLHFLEVLDEGRAGVVALEVGDVVGLAGEALRLHEVVAAADGLLEFLDDDGSLVHQPDLAGLVSLRAGEEGDGGIDGVLLVAEVEDVAVGLGAVEHAVGAGEGLNQPWCLRFLST